MRTVWALLAMLTCSPLVASAEERTPAPDSLAFSIGPRDLERPYNTLVDAYRVSSPIALTGCDRRGICDYQLAPGLTITLAPAAAGGTSRAMIFYAGDARATADDLVDAIRALALVLSSEVSAAEIRAATGALFPRGAMPARTTAEAADLSLTMTSKGGFRIDLMRTRP